MFALSFDFDQLVADRELLADLLSHVRIVPSSIESERRGITPRPSGDRSLQRRQRRFHDMLLVRDRGLLQPSALMRIPDSSRIIAGGPTSVDGGLFQAGSILGLAPGPGDERIRKPIDRKPVAPFDVHRLAPLVDLRIPQASTNGTESSTP